MTVSDAYLEDAKVQLSLASQLIKRDATPYEQWHAVLLAAIGIEKLLKYVLARINPALVLKTMDFESIVVACHAPQITTPDRLLEVSKKANSDVVTMKSAVQRVSLFSAAVKSHSQFIHALADARDVAAHRPWIEADLQKIAVMLGRDLFVAVSAIAECIGIAPTDLMRGHAIRLQQMSFEIAEEEDLNTRMQEKLRKHLAMWQDRSSKPILVEGAKKVTYARLAAESYASICKCPACGNEALVIEEPDIDYDYDSVEETACAIVVGFSVDQVKCFYCSLLVDQYDELRYINAEALTSG
jgi:hypothetical protein